MSGNDKYSSVLERCDKVMAFSICALAYFLPISTALVESFFGVGLVAYIVKKISILTHTLRRAEDKSLRSTALLFLKAFLPKQNFLNKPLALYLGITFISVFFSYFPMVSLSAYFTKVAEGCLIFFIFVESINSRKRLKIYLVVFVAAALLVTINGVTQLVVGKGFTRGFELVEGRMLSSFKHPNSFGAYLILVVTLSFYFLLTCLFTGQRDKLDGNQKKGVVDVFSWPSAVVMAVLFVLSVLCMGFSFSRGAWLGLFAALLLAFFKKRSYIVISVVFISLYITVFVPQMEKIRNTTLLTDYADITHAQKEKSDSLAGKIKVHFEGFNAMGRIDAWQEAVNIIKDHPLIGTGLNTYPRVAKDYKISWGGYPHNSYLHMITETGFLGAGSFLWVIFVFFWQSFKNQKRITDPLYMTIVWGMLTGLLGFYLHAVVDSLLYSVQLVTLMWLTMGAVVVTQKLSADDNPD